MFTTEGYDGAARVEESKAMSGDCGALDRETVLAVDIRRVLTQEEDNCAVYSLDGARISGVLDLRHCTVTVAVDIRRCVFLDGVEFGNCEFEQSVDLSGCTFCEEFDSGSSFPAGWTATGGCILSTVGPLYEVDRP